MILNISIQNYRSFKKNVVFSMIAESSKSKEQNVFIQKLPKGDDEIRLLNTSLIYGANASGKSNLLRSIFDIRKLITQDQPTAGADIVEYDPFKFDKANDQLPIEFYIEFIGTDNIKYRYELSYSRSEILLEELMYWPNNKPVQLLSRKVSKDKNSLVHYGFMGPSLGGDNFEIFKNQTLLSKFGKERPNDIISKVYIYFEKLNVINACSQPMIEKARADVNVKFLSDNNFAKRINELLKFSDTGLDGVSVKKLEESEFKFPDTFPEDEKSRIFKRNMYTMFGLHSYFSEEEKIDIIQLPFKDESNGTRAIYALGGKMLDVIEDGGVLFVDELETSFHPFLAKMLVCLFQNKKINSKNAQLVFATHDTNLLDRTLFRKDQVWFTEKDYFGATELYSLQDFSEVREDTPFDRWYLAGKFGGVPNLQSLESLFSENEKE